MSDAWQGNERREHPRVPIAGELQGKIETTIDVPLVDVSLSGALLETPSTLTANSRYILKVVASDAAAFEAEVEVVRSYVHGFDRGNAGQYRVAIRFVELTEPQETSLQELMDRRSGIALRAHLSS
jgi:c-di-GMP-binding flagellar brake protein YcgR